MVYLFQSGILVATLAVVALSLSDAFVIDVNNNLITSEQRNTKHPPLTLITAAARSTTKSTTYLLMAGISADVTPSYKYVAEGMELFRQGDVQGSIKCFDASVTPGSKAYLWQRGLSYYYADEFAKGSQQFKDDVLRSPLDVEEIVWDIACLLRMDPNTFPPTNMMSLPPGRTDRRPIMVSYDILDALVWSSFCLFYEFLQYIKEKRNTK